MEKLSRKQDFPVMTNDEARASSQERIVKRRPAPFVFPQSNDGRQIYNFILEENHQ
jgi:hypothetical protein